MAFHLRATVIIVVLCLDIAAIHAALSSEQYWKSVFPDTPMPRAIELVVRSGLGKAYVNRAADNSGYGNSGYGGSAQKKVDVVPAYESLLAGNSGYSNSGYQNNKKRVDVVNPQNSGYGNSGYNNNQKKVNVVPVYESLVAGNSGYSNSGYQNKKKRVEVVNPQNSGYGNSGYQNNRKKVDTVKPSVSGSLRAGNSGYGNSGYQNNKEKDLVNPPTALYFLEKDMHPGREMNLLISRRESDATTFIPRQVANSIPFSSSKFPAILNKLSVKPGSRQAELMKETIRLCEQPANKGEAKLCATSLESMVEFASSVLGKKIQAVSTKAEKDSQLQKFTILKGIKEIASDEAMVCHRENYPYAVFLCHSLKGTKTYLVPLVGADGTKATSTAVCHMDTSDWNPEHLAMQVLHVKPGQVSVCHFLPETDVVWTRK